MHDLEIKTNKGLYLLSCQFLCKKKETITMAITTYKENSMTFVKSDYDGLFYKENEDNEYLEYVKNTYEHYIYKR